MSSQPISSPILEGLNPAQRDAVINYDAPSLIIAGAGSGKTRVLTSRIAYMIEQGIKPWNILALTFTNKAAEQMRERIAQMLPDGQCRYIRMGTFHSIFSRILHENAEAIGFPKTFTIYEPNDVKHLLKTIIGELHLNPDQYKPNVIASRISFAKNCLVTPGAYLANDVCATEDRQAKIPEFGNIYNIYCQRCKHNGAMDFDDLLLQTNILLRDCPEVLAKYQEQFRYILVDEYQDTNYAQYVIIRRLSQHHSKVCVVGDDAQSIYSFRGAKIENILSFKKDYPTAMVFKLEQNYRSTRTIVDAANSVITHNAKRMDKQCFSKGDEGEKIRILRAYTDREEADLVVGDLRDRIRETGDRWAEVAILYRTNNQSAVLEDNLRRRGVPYRIYKGSSFYDHKEIRDMLGYIRLVINPRDDEAFQRIINYPVRGIGNTTVERIAALAEERKVSMWEAIDALVEEPATDTVQKAIIRKVREFVGMIRDLSLAQTTMGLYDFGMVIATRSGILNQYRTEQTPEAASAVSNIEELLNSMQLFKEQRDAEIRNGERSEEEQATIEEWLQSVMLTTDMDKDNPEDDNKVTLMTVHSAKGLEYKYVYIVGMEQNLFPSQRASETADGMEEERRLFYVALTRAKVAATISYAEMRYKWGNMEFSHPSCFLKEIDPQYVDYQVDEEDGFRREGAEGETAVEQLRRNYDYRFQKKRSEESGEAYEHHSGSYGGRAYGGGSSRFGMPSDGESGRAQRFPSSARGSSPKREGCSSYNRPQASQPAPKPVNVAGMRRVAVRVGELSASVSTPTSGSFEVGQKVAHAKFGKGVIISISTISTDQMLEIDFGAQGRKKLLMAFARKFLTIL